MLGVYQCGLRLDGVMYVCVSCNSGLFVCMAGPGYLDTFES